MVEYQTLFGKAGSRDVTMGQLFLNLFPVQTEIKDGLPSIEVNLSTAKGLFEKICHCSDCSHCHSLKYQGQCCQDLSVGSFSTAILKKRVK